MSKRYAILISTLFCLFLFGFGVAHLLTPDRDFSQQENRYLASFPRPTLATLKDGSFMEDFEDYIIDQFPFRDGWIALKAGVERLLGKQENNGVYLGTDGQTLFAQYTPPDDLAVRVGYVNELASHLEIPVWFALIPDKSYVWADRLPAHAPLVDDGSVLTGAAALVSPSVHWIDLSGALSGEDAFYRTDHHWTTQGAAQVHQALGAAMYGGATLPDTPLTQVADDFYGTTWSSSGARWVAPDVIHTWVPEQGLSVTSHRTGEGVSAPLYDRSFLEKKDKYSLFLGGNQSLCVIENPEGTRGKLLVIRDSYADSLAPFLALDHQEVHLWDLRHNRSSLAQYVAQQEIDRVLVLYSNANFATDSNLFFMTR